MFGPTGNSEIQIQITRSMIFRDIGIYIIATLFTIYCATEGYITLTDSCVFLILYLILVLVVVIANRLPANQKSQQEIDVIARTSKAALEDDDDVFSIDTDAIEIATPTPPPPAPDRPGFDQKLTDHSNSRIVIEVLEDEAWPEDLSDPADPERRS